MSRKVRKYAGVIGLGIIGSRVSAGLRAAGYQTYVWNRTAKPVPNFLGSPAEVAESAEIIQIFVADAEALMEVIENMSEALTPKHVIMCNATVGPEGVLEAQQLIEARGAQFLDAPFTGSKIAAEKRQLVYYVGGAEAAFLRAQPVLEVTSKAILRMGEVGHAATIKVVTNLISAVTTQVLAEALSIVKKAGLDPEMLTAAIEQNACRSGVIDLKLPKMLKGDYEPHFSLKHMFKDVQLGIHMANALDIEIPATTVTAGVMYGALNNGWGDLDYAVLFKNYTPSEIFEELPALEHVLGTIEPPAEELAIPENATNAEPVAVPSLPISPPEALAVKEPSHTPELLPATVMPFSAEPPPIFGKAVTAEPVAAPPPEEEMPAKMEPHLPAPAEPVLEVLPPAQAPPRAVNGNVMRDAVPTEEAARIIEAVLARVSGQRGESGVLPSVARNLPVSVPPPVVAEQKTTVAVAASTSSSAPATARGAKPAEAAKPEKVAKKPAAKPIDFVRKWFAGRS